MSFILEDNELVELLIKHAQTGQPTAEDVTALRGLVDGLEKQLAAGPTATGPEVTSDVRGGISLASPQLKNLSTLVQFLLVAGISVDGKRVVVQQNELPNDPSYVPYEFPGDTSMRRTQVLTIKVNKDLLDKYLNTLRGHLSDMPNPLLEAQVNSITQEANSQLGTNISGTYKEPSKILAEGQLLDKVPQDVRTDNQLAEGTIPLFYGDITSDTTFNGWIQRNNVGVDGRAYKHPQYDKCALLRALSARAKSYVSNATTEQEKNTYNTYSEQIPHLATAFKCDLGGGQSGAAPGAGAAATGMAAVEQIVESLPLQNSDLDFGRIRNFINQYKSLITTNVDPVRASQANTAMEQAEQYMQEATRNTASNLTQFQMDGLNAQDLIELAKPPSSGQPVRAQGSAMALADYLDYVVRSIYTMVKDFYTTHMSMLDANPRWRQLVEQQVGGKSIPYGSSIAADNLRNINIARSYLTSAGA